MPSFSYNSTLLSNINSLQNKNLKEIDHHISHLHPSLQTYHFRSLRNNPVSIYIYKRKLKLDCCAKTEDDTKNVDKGNPRNPRT